METKLQMSITLFQKIISLSQNATVTIQNLIRSLFTSHSVLSEKAQVALQTCLLKFENSPTVRTIFLESLITPLNELSEAVSRGFDIKKAFKVQNILIQNVPDLLLDPELQASSTTILTSRLTKIKDLLVDMMSDRKDFMIVSESPVIPTFLDISKRLKNALIQSNDANGLSWNPREENLWLWCRTMLEHTVHPDYREILNNPTISETIKLDIQEKFHVLFDIENKTIMEIAFSDDVADNLKDPMLTSILIKIPFGQESELDKQREFLQTYCSGIYIDYYDLARQVWNDALQGFKQLVGENIYQRIQTQYIDHYQKIMNSMTFSLNMNLNPHDKDLSIEAINKVLPYNMMVECFRFMEKALVLSLEEAHQCSLITETPEDILIKESIIETTQLIASLSNSTATIYRELKESDMTNVLLSMANKHKLKTLTESGITFKDDFINFQKQNNFENHFFQLYGEPSDLFSLIQTKNAVLPELLASLNALSRNGISLSVLETNDIQGYVTKVIELIEIAVRERGVNESVIFTKNILTRRLSHLKLIDSYIKKAVRESNTTQICIDTISGLIDSCKEKSRQLSTIQQRNAMEAYIDSWQDFFAMYLIFKHNTHGAI